MEIVSAPVKIWTSGTAAPVEKRDVWTALKRGLRGRCPRCGEGRLFRAFLKVDNNCSSCGLDFTPHRADDLMAPSQLAGKVATSRGAERSWRCFSPARRRRKARRP